MRGNGEMNSLKSSRAKDTSVIDFILGVILTIVGLYFIGKNTSVGVIWMSHLLGTGLPSGIVSIPIILAIAVLIMNHKSYLGWILLGIGMVILLIQIILSVKITFNSTSLWQYLWMFGGTFGGLGLLARAFLR